MSVMDIIFDIYHWIFFFYLCLFFGVHLNNISIYVFIKPTIDVHLNNRQACKLLPKHKERTLTARHWNKSTEMIFGRSNTQNIFLNHWILSPRQLKMIYIYISYSVCVLFGSRKYITPIWRKFKLIWQAIKCTDTIFHLIESTAEVDRGRRLEGGG